MSNVPAEQAVQRYLFEHYGDLILADTPIFDARTQAYVANLKSDYPLMVNDDRLSEVKLCILKADHLGTIFVDKDYHIMPNKTTSRENCIENLKLFFKLWLERAEEIIVASSAETLVNVSRFRHYFDPIDAILVSLCDYGRISDEEIATSRSSERLAKIRLYLELLEGLEIVRKIEDGYVAGNTFVAIKEKYPKMNEQELRNALLGHIIRERYPTLRDVFRLTILEPTIHVDSCIYLPELEEEQPIYRTIESIHKDYKEYYNKRISILDLRLNLRRLENVKAIERDNRHYFGNQVLLDQMIDKKRHMAPISMGLLAKP